MLLCNPNLILIFFIANITAPLHQVRSLTLDKWSAPRLALIQQAGNARANSWWEAKVNPSTGQVTVPGKGKDAAATAAKGLAGNSRTRKEQQLQQQEITMTKPNANPTRAAAEVQYNY